MSLTFGTAEWAEALEREINGSSEYRNAAARWGTGFNGAVLLAFEPDSALRQPLYLFLKLRAGRCEGAAFVPGPGDPGAGFTLRGPFTLWRDILERRTLAATAILTGKLKVEGEMLTLLTHAGASRALIHCVASLDTSYPSNG